MTSILQRPLPVLTAAMTVAVAIGAATSTPWPRGLAAQAPRADLIVVNGPVFTGAGWPVAEAVAVTGDRITAVGRPPAAADDVQVQTTIFGGAVVHRRERP